MIRKVLILGWVVPEPKSSAAGIRMMQLINLFKFNCYQITFASTALNLEFSEDLSTFDIDFKKIQLNSKTFDEFVSELDPNIVLFDRFMIEEQFGWRVTEQCPNALKILNTEDFHSLRYVRQQAIKENLNFEFQKLLSSEITKREVASIYRCDLSLFVSEFEIEILKSQFKIQDNLLFHMPIFAEKLKQIPEFEVRKDFVFIGNFLHQPNLDCVNYLSKVIWPKIHKILPHAKMLVYGAYASPKVLELNKPKQNFYIMGRAENALEVVKFSKFVLAPIRFGAGIKGKLLEAMQCGTPSITTTIGAEAMYGDLPWNGFIEDDQTVFAEKAILAYSDAILWNDFQKNGFRILEERFKSSDFIPLFLEKIEMLRNNLNEHRKKNFIGALLTHHSLNSTKYMSKWIEEKNKNISQNE